MMRTLEVQKYYKDKTEDDFRNMIRTPLTSILIYSQLIERKIERKQTITPEELLILAQSIISQVRRIDDFITEHDKQNEEKTNEKPDCALP